MCYDGGIDAADTGALQTDSVVLSNVGIGPDAGGNK
jgi:hypothetical protein